MKEIAEEIGGIKGIPVLENICRRVHLKKLETFLEDPETGLKQFM